jgi:DNA repair exonuclease SbcCD ATPase subunit
VNTPTYTRSTPLLSSLHARLTVLQAGAEERARLAEALIDGLGGNGYDGAAMRGTTEFFDAAREVALRRIEEHERIRGELTAQLRKARDVQAGATNRRDEAAARVRRMAAHLADSEALLEQSAQLRAAAAEAERDLEARRAEVEASHYKLSLVEEQRAAAAQMIDDASHQLRYLEAAELDEPSLRRELEAAGQELRAAESAQAEANEGLRAIEQATADRDATRQHVHYERAELVARIESPLVDVEALRRALDAFDDEVEPGEADLVARELAREWSDVDDELDRIESALPVPPTDDEVEAAERRLDQIENAILELEAAAGRGPGGRVDPRDEIEDAHEAVLAAEERLDDPQAYEQALAELQHARDVEQAVLHRHGFDTYLDVILSGPVSEGESQAELLDALRARRVAEETVAALRAAAEPPAIVTALRSRRDRIRREATDLLGCDPGDNVAELLHAHPVVPAARTRELAIALSNLGVHPVGVAVREAAAGVLDDQDDEIAAREDCRSEVDRLDRELAALDQEDERADEHAQRVQEMAEATDADVAEAAARVHLLESELVDRASQDERRLQRIAAAEQLRSQITAVTDALNRSNEEYHAALAQSETEVLEAQGAVERAASAIADARQRLRRISDALPPVLRPRPADDPLTELPNLRETLAAEVDRAEAALDEASDELDDARRDIERSQDELDAHLQIVPTEDIAAEDLAEAVADLVGRGDTPVVLDDPFTESIDERDHLLDRLVPASALRPVILLTDDPDTLGWAIGLPADVGTVTRLSLPTGPAGASGIAPVAAQPGSVG